MVSHLANDVPSTQKFPLCFSGGGGFGYLFVNPKHRKFGYLFVNPLQREDVVGVMVSHLANDVPSPQKFLQCGGGGFGYLFVYP